VIRTQLQIDENTYETLRLRAHLEKKSMSAVAREILSEGLTRGTGGRRRSRAALSFISSGASGRKDISERHDDALAEDFK
jgi:plasmid stability protein